MTTFLLHPSFLNGQQLPFWGVRNAHANLHGEKFLPAEFEHAHARSVKKAPKIEIKLKTRSWLIRI